MQPTLHSALNELNGLGGSQGKAERLSIMPSALNTLKEYSTHD